MDTIRFVFQLNQFSKNLFSHFNCSHSFQRACTAPDYHTKLLAFLAMAKETLSDEPKELTVDNLSQAFTSFEDRAICHLYMTHILASFVSIKKEWSNRLVSSGLCICWVWQLLASL